MKTWAFITNYAVVLCLINRAPTITAAELSDMSGITERAVRKIIADLEKEGYLSKAKEGRRVRYSVNHLKQMRHSTQRDKEVGELLRLLKS